MNWLIPVAVVLFISVFLFSQRKIIKTAVDEVIKNYNAQKDCNQEDNKDE